MRTGHDLELVDVTKRYGTAVAVADVSHPLAAAMSACSARRAAANPRRCG